MFIIELITLYRWIHFMPRDRGAQLLLMTHYMPDSVSADCETKCLSGIFKILAYSLLHSLSGIHVAHTVHCTHLTYTELSYNFSTLHGHPQTQLPLLSSSCAFIQLLCVDFRLFSHTVYHMLFSG